MDSLKERGLVFGASVTVTKENIKEVTSDAFLKSLSERGCKAVIFVEYVPVTLDDEKLTLDDNDRDYLMEELRKLRMNISDMVYIAFPGDEKNFGGCVAAGRGFFHINSHGGAEPCPFSLFSDINIKDTSLREALHSPLFSTIRDGNILKEDHKGGCVLFEKREQVEAIINQNR
jgi:MoaA/NifB/PqqE/SkfB family radical SAM enzyme